MNTQSEEILKLLYFHRFLTRHEIQYFLNHKHHAKINLWLNQLSEQHFIHRFYNPSTINTPAVYSLDSKGRKYLLGNSDKFPFVDKVVLNRIWKENKYEQDFRDKCIFLANINICLERTSRAEHLKLAYLTRTQLNGIEPMVKPLPDSYFYISNINKNLKLYFVDYFYDLPPRMALRKRVKKYIAYFDTNSWQEETNTEFPIIIFVLPDQRSINYLSKFIKTLDDEYEDLKFRLVLRSEILSDNFIKSLIPN